MDWTGGVRRRYAAGKNNASLLKQKQHFAKARAEQSKSPTSRLAVAPSSTAIGSRSSNHRYAVERPTSRASHGKSASPRQAANPSESIRTRGELLFGNGLASRFLSLQGTVIPTAQKSFHSSAPYGANVSDEERLLLARRHSLLKRDDWLGLAATRPVHLDFQSNPDKDRVGKRRKISRSTKDARTNGQQRPLPPLFEERLPRRDHFMSGALPRPDICVKVGTEALASQTQASRRSHTPDNTSLRPLTTQQSLLSEESMLLGSEDVDFSAVQIAAPIDVPLMVPLSDRDHLTGVTQGGTREITASIEAPSQPQMVAHPRTRSPHQVQPDGTLASQYSFHVLEKATHTPPFLRRESDREVTAPRQQTRADGMPSLSPLPHAEADAGGVSQYRIVNDTDSDDSDSVWRRILDVQAPDSSRNSVKALKSSSQHITGSSSSRRPALGPPDSPLIDDVDTIATPKGAGTQEPVGMSPYAVESSSASASTSLAQWQRLAHLPPLNPVADEAANSEDERDNALWREFIIGSDDGSDSIFRHLCENVPRPNEPRLSKQSDDSPIRTSDKRGYGIHALSY